MKTTIFLRIASALAIIHAVLHTVGGVFGKPVQGTGAMVAATMEANRFQVFGVTRSYADFYRGLGLGITIFLLLSAVIFWQLGTLAKRQVKSLRPIIAALGIAFVALAINSQLYFFSGPVIVEILIALCLGTAFFTAKKADDRMTAQAATEV